MFIVQKEPKSIGAEAYKDLRTNIQYSSFDKESQIIIVTSSQPGEGKSTTAGNLALAMAQDGKKTLLIDCDLRLPTMHKKFSISNNLGLSEIIIGKTIFLEALKPINNNLSVITAGKIPPNPAEMLGSQNMKRLLEELRKHYEYIILDTPPVLAVSDAQILSNVADGLVLVIRAGVTKKDLVIKAKRKIEVVKGKIIGAILNGASLERGNYYYYYGNDKK